MTSSSRHDRGLPVREQREEERAKLVVPLRLLRLGAAEPLEQLPPRTSVGAEQRGLQSDLRRESERGLGAELDLGRLDREPPVRGLGLRRAFHRRPPAALDAPAEPRRRDDRRREHDDEQDGVVARLQRAAREAERREDDADLSAGIIPMPIEHAGRRSPADGMPATTLPTTATTPSTPISRSDSRVADRADARLRADQQEEHGDEEVRHRCEPPAQVLLLLDATERDAGHERSDDRREPAPPARGRRTRA